MWFRYLLDSISPQVNRTQSRRTKFARRNSLKCGIAAVDLTSGRVAGFLEFQTAFEEIFDVQLLPGQRVPELIGIQKDEVNNTFIVPPPTADASVLP
jgi:hypothetical protein